MESRYGSHSSMKLNSVIQLMSRWSGQIADNEVICKDRQGLFVTYADRIDSGLSDSRRWDR